ncbi:transglutaminase domain-containing protein [Winogradskyella undariae]|uniref:transglutaminase-like domain-containing protein n=1 Tax=Winogradskyella undariae TaxID=1285465 RepID=UPI00156A7EF1|nr:transglutaminase-like domain-containing protein [Winogradskyella undariae]NRR90978.1 transglutaminase domain-containing protein [Winogradskyella undariae]
MIQSINQKQNKTKQFSFIILLVSSFLFAQAQHSEEFKILKDKYPESTFVRLMDEINISIKLKDNEVEIKQHFIEEDLYLDDTATYGSKKSLDFSSFFELESVEATSYQFKDGKYKSYKVENFIEKDEMGDSFHDDTKSLNFIYSNLAQGGKTKLEYTEIVKNPRFLSPIYFGNFYPIKTKKVTLVADKEFNFKFLEFNTEGYDINFKKEEKRSSNIYTWEIKNVNEIKYESNVPTYKKVLPHIVPIITSYNNENKKVKILDNVSDLYNWYFSMVKDINQQPTDKSLVSLVKEITKDSKTDLDKVRAIYYWTQQNIKYIAFEYALGGFIPREANDVFNKKYGDCKDNSSILFEMLKTAGLKGNLTWIGTRAIPYTYTELPTPMVDNHMILTYSENGKTYFLDATGRYLALEMPSSFIQGKEALIGDGEGKFKIETVPVMSPKTNAYTENSTLTINENQLLGKGENTLSGYYKIDFFNQLEYNNSEKELKAYYTVKLRKGNNKFIINDFKETNKYSYDEDFKINYDYTISDYVKQLDDEIYVNLNLNRTLTNYKTEDDRENEIEVDYKCEYTFNNILEVPENYSIDYIPENFELKNDYFSCLITYQLEDHKITYNQQLIMDYITLTPEEQKIVNTAIKKVEKQYKETVVLKKSH